MILKKRNTRVSGKDSSKYSPSEAVKAIIVVKPGEAPTQDSIIAWARERIAGYKCPKTVEFIEVLPRNPSGKVLRKDLRETYWKDQARRIS